MNGKWIVIAACFGAAACSQSSVEMEALDGRDATFLVDGKADAFGVSEGSPLAEGILRLTNSASRELFEDEVGLYGRTLDMLLAHRDGDDGQLGTADDDLLDSLEELDAVPYMGPRSFERIAEFATLNGYVNHAADQHEILAGLTEPRRNHVSVQLDDGRILVAGGMGSDGRLASSEVFDPTTRSWSPTGALATARTDATAALLADGRVLVAGGYGSESQYSLRTTEIWDPSTGSWEQGPEMNNGRMNHTATALPDGRVLVVGGQNSPRSYTEPSAEVLDVVAGSWREVGDTPVGIQHHTATLTPDGSVVIVGGYNRFEKDRTRTILQFDPTTDTLRVAGRLETARDHHTATVVADALLIAGGEGNRHRYLSSTELIDLRTFETRSLPPLNKARSNHAATVLPSGDIAVLGGNDVQGHRGILEVDVFDPTTETWSLGAPLYAGLQGFDVHDFQGEPLLVGGEVSSQESTPSLLYREGSTRQVDVPTTEVVRDWEVVENFGEAVRCTAGTVEYHEASGQLICFMGRAGENEPIGTYVWGSAGWEELVAPLDSPLPPRTHHTMTYDSARGKIVLFGGQKRYGFDLDDIWEFDGQRWEKVEPTTAVVPPRQRGGEIVYDSARERSILLPGYQDGTYQNDVYAWHGDRWEQLPGDHAAVFGNDPYDSRGGYGAAYDPTRDRLVVLGGWANGRATPTYEYDGERWIQGGSGGPQHGAAIDATFDPVAGEIYAVGVAERSRHYVSAVDVFSYDGQWARLGVGRGFRTNNFSQALFFDGSTGHLTIGLNSLQQLREHETPNARPSMHYIGEREAHANERLTVQIEAGDPNGHDMTFTHTPLPDGATFDPETLLFEWTPGPTQGGEHWIEFTVSDGALTSNQQLTITVEGLVTYASLPQGAVDMTGGVTMDGIYEFQERNRWVWDDATYRVSCHFVGQNPGRVTYTCTINRTNAGWPHTHETTVGGEVLPDGRLSGGISGRVEALQWDDYELVVTGLGANFGRERWRSSGGEYRGYLNRF